MVYFPLHIIINGMLMDICYEMRYASAKCKDKESRVCALKMKGLHLR